MRHHIMKQSKRTTLKSYLALALTFLSAKSNILLAAWPTKAFEAKEVEQAISQITGDQQAQLSNEIHIKVPDIAENGAVVPVTVSTDLTGVKRISIIVENNPNPLTSSFEFNNDVTPFVSTRVKMAGTSDITAIITTTDNTYYNKRNIKVTIGGCGG